MLHRTKKRSNWLPCASSVGDGGRMGSVASSPGTAGGSKSTACVPSGEGGDVGGRAEAEREVYHLRPREMMRGKANMRKMARTVALVERR